MLMEYFEKIKGSNNFTLFKYVIILLIKSIRNFRNLLLIKIHHNLKIVINHLKIR